MKKWLFLILVLAASIQADTLKIDYGYGVAARTGYELDTAMLLDYHGYSVDTLLDSIYIDATGIDTFVVLTGSGYHRIVLYGIYDGYPNEWYEVKTWEVYLTIPTTLSGVGPYAMTIRSVDSSGVDAVVSGVPITLKDLAGTARGGPITTVGGVATFHVDSGSWIITAPTYNGYVWIQDTVLVPAAAKTDTLWGYNIAVGSPGSANLCRLYGYIYNISGAAVEGATVTASLSGSGLIDSCAAVSLDGYEVSATTDSVGYWYLDLVKTLCVQSTVGGTAVKYYKVVGRYPSGNTAFSKSYEVPDSTSHKITW